MMFPTYFDHLETIFAYQAIQTNFPNIISVLRNIFNHNKLFKRHSIITKLIKIRLKYILFLINLSAYHKSNFPKSFSAFVA